MTKRTFYSKLTCSTCRKAKSLLSEEGGIDLWSTQVDPSVPKY